MSSTSSPTPSKRHSLHTSGPKPLQLLNGPLPSIAPSSPVPLATPVHYPSSLNQSKPRAPRRQSSISYKRSSYDSLTQSRQANEADPPPQPQNGLSGEKLRPRSAIYPSAPLLPPPAVEDRPPLTLAEKHADLLQFIAQKESKCLELRSQLTVHEAELLQLKRTWERIVSRGFEFPHSALPTPATTTSTPSPPTIHAPYPSNVVLEGIKEGASRLIASGLSTSNADPLSTNSYHAYSDSRPNSRPRPHSLHFPPSSHVRSSNLSTSSTCTTATSATRFSAASPSSVSTFFEEQESWCDDAEQKQKTIDDLGRDATESSRNGSPDSSSCSQELMVRDTGATPTVSPNPKFKFGIDRRREKDNQRGRNEGEDMAGGGWTETGNCNVAGTSILDGLGKDEQREGTLRTLTANSSAIHIDAGSTRCHRRKSRETTSSGYLRPGDGESGAPARFSPRSRSSSPNPSTKTTPGGGTLPPISSLAESLTGGDFHPPAPAPAPISPTRAPNPHPTPEPSQNNHSYSSWTKRWTLGGKGQKRASSLLSDVSQTLFSTFSLAAGGAGGSLAGSAASSASVSGPSSRSNSRVSTPLGAKQAATMSLLEEDAEGFSAMLQPMKPVVLGSNASTGLSRGVRIAISPTNETEDDDGEWNW